jgi:aminoglycoside phosphotransferase (APT) family kinase protein
MSSASTMGIGERNGLPIPLTLDDATSALWLGVALGVYLQDAVIESTSVEGTLHGVATKAIVNVHYQGAVPTDLPSSYCVKAGYEPHNAHLLEGGAYSREARFYRDLAPRLGMSTPRVFLADYDVSTNQGVILMENLHERNVVFGDAHRGFTRDEAARVLAELAKLHAGTWSATHTGDFAWVPSVLATIADPDYIFANDRLQELLDGSRGDSVPGAVRDGARLHDALQVLAERNDGSPHCLLHGDTHVRNMYLDSDGMPGLYDWQTIQFGRWSLDVAYFLGASLDAKDREATVRELLAHYCGELRARGVEPPTAELAWQWYRKSIVYGLYLWVITREIVQPLDVITTFVTRLGGAVDEAGSFEVLGV